MNTADQLQQQADAIKQQWQTQKLKNIAVQTNDSAQAVSAELTLKPKLSLSLSAVVSVGLKEDISSNLILSAALPEPINFSHSALPLAAFVNQATALLTPLSLILDLQTERLLIQQSQIIANTLPPDTQAFLNILNIVAPLIQDAVGQLVRQEINPGDARLMANLLAQQYYGAISV